MTFFYLILISFDLVLPWSLKKIRNFISHVKGQIDEITNEISDTKDEINETFHDKIEKLRLEIEKEPEFFDITPKLKIEKKHKTKKEKWKKKHSQNYPYLTTLMN